MILIYLITKTRAFFCSWRYNHRFQYCYSPRKHFTFAEFFSGQYRISVFFLHLVISKWFWSVRHPFSENTEPDIGYKLAIFITWMISPFLTSWIKKIRMLWKADHECRMYTKILKCCRYLTTINPLTCKHETETNTLPGLSVRFMFHRSVSLLSPLSGVPIGPKPANEFWLWVGGELGKLLGLEEWGDWLAGVEWSIIWSAWEGGKTFEVRSFTSVQVQLRKCLSSPQLTLAIYWFESDLTGERSLHFAANMDSTKTCKGHIS